ncbi:MAG: CRISPR-associated endonuclease Cas1 [Spirochaetota bacterium]|nr:CRISPR-associated endonuclease Cas1 [Spirochaetota bacterium]
MQHIVVSTPGAFLGKKSERLSIKKGDGADGGEVVDYVPLFRIEEITIASQGVSLSSNLVEECMKRGIKISFLSKSGAPYGILSSPFLTGTIKTRRSQFKAYDDARSVDLAKAIVGTKIFNQGALLRYFGKYIKKTDEALYEAISGLSDRLKSIEASISRLQGQKIEDLKNQIMGIEGEAASSYWQGVSAILGSEVFGKREHRGATDPFNSSLNYGYGILYSRISSALLNAGLDLYAGFLHADRSGKPSLVLDFIEEFRQPVVDRGVVSIFNKSKNSIKVKEGLLDDNSRKFLAARITANLESEVDFKGQRISLNSVIQKQARGIASFLRGDEKYTGYRFKW